MSHRETKKIISQVKKIKPKPIEYDLWPPMSIETRDAIDNALKQYLDQFVK